MSLLTAPRWLSLNLRKNLKSVQWPWGPKWINPFSPLLPLTSFSACSPISSHTDFILLYFSLFFNPSKPDWFHPVALIHSVFALLSRECSLQILTWLPLSLRFQAFCWNVISPELHFLISLSELSPPFPFPNLALSGSHFLYLALNFLHSTQW